LERAALELNDLVFGEEVERMLACIEGSSADIR
jgi:hypothetical protein